MTFDDGGRHAHEKSWGAVWTLAVTEGELAERLQNAFSSDAAYIDAVDGGRLTPTWPAISTGGKTRSATACKKG